MWLDKVDLKKQGSPEDRVRLNLKVSGLAGTVGGVISEM